MEETILLNPNFFASLILLSCPITFLISPKSPTSPMATVFADNGLFLNEEIRSRRFFEVIDDINDQDGIIILPHPYKNSTIDPEKIINEVDLVEILNGRISKILNQKARDLTDKYRLQVIAGSDAHTHLEFGCVRISITDSCDGLDEIRKHLLKGNVEIKGGESKEYIQILSRAMGRYKQSGISGFATSGIKKVFRRI